jgi:hypothetical protein
MLRIPHCLDNRLASGARLLASRAGHVLPPRTVFYFCLWYFCHRLNNPRGQVRSEMLGRLITLILLLESRTHDLPACSSVPMRGVIEESRMKVGFGERRAPVGGPPLWSSAEFLAANPEVLGLIPGATRFSEYQWMWNGSTQPL